GYDAGKGYLMLRADGVLYMLHRVAWLIAAGRWPVGQIDHINGIRSNNRLANLRDVTSGENMQNMRRAQVRNQCGLLGVSQEPRTQRWVSRIQVDGRQQHLGTFATAEEAQRAYLRAKRQLHPKCTI
ncbi:HNH endonuclease, partial [Nostoc sp. NIES-2111]